MATKNSVFKYFSQKQHLQEFLEDGVVFFNTLSYFLSCEDLARRDVTEDANVYMPADGLDITITTTNQKLKDSRALVSRVKQPDRVFVFCASIELSENLFHKFGAAGCVEIPDVEEFRSRIKRHLIKSAHNIKNKEILFGKIEYYGFEEVPKARYACPKQIIMSKSSRFSDEKEYRVAFAKDVGAFDSCNVNYTLAHGLEINEAIGKPKKFILGSLSDIAKVVM